MLVAVKKPPIEFVIQGNIPDKYLRLLKTDYGTSLTVDDNSPYELATESAWYQKMKAQDSAGAALRFYRKLHTMTQPQLAAKMGVSKQKVSNMENGIIPISRKTALLLGELFQVPAGRFIG